MRLPPLSVIAEWPTPNYKNPVTRGPANLILNCVFFPIALFIILIRVYTRVRISKSFGLDDWLIVAALFPAAVFGIVCLVNDRLFGWNRHIWDILLTTSKIALGLKLVMLSQIMFAVATTLTKLSMLTLTYRITSNAINRLGPLIIAVMVVISLEAISFSLIVIFQCRPISLYWTIYFSAQPTCISEPAHLLAAGIINTITDFAVVAIPIPIVLTLKMARREAMIITLLFSAGFIASCAGAVRTYYTYKVTISNDKTWDIFLFWVPATIELYIGIICASIPATKKFFSRYLPTILRSTTQSKAISGPQSPSESYDISLSARTPKLQSFNSISAEEHEKEGKSSPPVAEIEKGYGRPSKVGSQGSNIYVETKISISIDERTGLGTAASDGTFAFEVGRTESQDRLVLVPL